MEKTKVNIEFTAKGNPGTVINSALIALGGAFNGKIEVGSLFATSRVRDPINAVREAPREDQGW